MTIRAQFPKVRATCPANLRLLSLGRGAVKPHIGTVSCKGNFVSKKQSVVPIGLATNSLGIPDGKSIQASQLVALTAVALITASGPKWSAESVKAQKDCGTAHLFFRLNPVSCERNASLHLAGWV